MRIFKCGYTNENLMRVISNLFMFFSFSCFLCMILSSAESHESPPNVVVSARLLDAHLQECAFKALFMPRTGMPYDAQVPSNLKGIKVSAMVLRSDSLRVRGVHTYKEYEIPSGVVEHPHVKRLVLVYHNLGNWSEIYYPLPGYSYLTPILGLLAYNAANLSASKLPELNLRASLKPILVKFPYVKSFPFGSLAKCVYFDLNGLVHFDILLPGNVCSVVQQGHISIVVESNSPSPSTRAHLYSGGKNKSKLRIIISCLVAAILLLIILGLLITRVKKAKRGTMIKRMEREADRNEALQIASFGNTKAPLAIATRTRPMIENDYIP